MKVSKLIKLLANLDQSADVVMPDGVPLVKVVPSSHQLLCRSSTVILVDSEEGSKCFRFNKRRDYLSILYFRYMRLGRTRGDRL